MQHLWQTQLPLENLWLFNAHARVFHHRAITEEESTFWSDSSYIFSILGRFWEGVGGPRASGGACWGVRGGPTRVSRFWKPFAKNWPPTCAKLEAKLEAKISLLCWKKKNNKRGAGRLRERFVRGLKKLLTIEGSWNLFLVHFWMVSECLGSNKVL